MECNDDRQVIRADDPERREKESARDRTEHRQIIDSWFLPSHTYFWCQSSCLCMRSCYFLWQEDTLVVLAESETCNYHQTDEAHSRRSERTGKSVKDDRMDSQSMRRRKKDEGNKISGLKFAGRSLVG